MHEATRNDRNLAGFGIAGLVLAVWAGSMAGLLQAPLDGPWRALWVPAAVLWMTWLFTGLFITGHDAMHGSITPGAPSLNHAVGALAVALYACFDYRVLRRAHREHHTRPGRPGDPDWHDGQHPDPMFWFFAFARRYLRFGQALRLFVWFGVLQEIFPSANVLAFWALPSVLSVGQLFFFGTYLPHREPEGGHTNPHHATSTRLGWWASLVTCFHFGGHHLEHHQHPSEPWWRLPAVRREAL